MENYINSGFFDFESLELYKKSLDYIDFVYELTAQFPKDDRFELTSQFIRAANSITLNIAEGYGESILLSLKYLKTFRGSIRECLECSTIAYRREYFNEKKYLQSRTLLTELSKLAGGYKKYLNGKLNK